MLKGVKKAHFIGLAGVGMAATAKLLKDLGIKVTGSDEDIYPPVSDLLKQEGLVLKTPYRAANIPTDTDMIVVGKSAKLVPEANAEVKAAYESGKKIHSFPEVLGELSKDKETIVVAGSYGKSTCAALLAHCLEEAGLSPSYFIGAVPFTPRGNAKMGSGKYFVLEGDEYPSSNSDKRSKFLHYHPSHLLLTPLAHDHFNVFPTPADYLQPFTSLIELVQKGGTIVACAEGPLSKQFIKKDIWPIISYGLREGDFHAGEIVWGATTSFSVSHGSTTLLKSTTTLLGEHNIQNIVGVAAFILSRELMSVEKLAAGIASFKGLRRRLDKKSSKTSLLIYEGFGSSYEKARSAIVAMKQHFPGKRLVVVFEPHTFGWRNRASLKSYDDVFEGSGQVYLLEPAEHGSGNQEEASFEEIVERVKSSGVAIGAAGSPEVLLDAMDENLQAGDAVLLLSSGPAGGLAESLPKLAEKKYPS